MEETIDNDVDKQVEEIDKNAAEAALKGRIAGGENESEEDTKVDQSGTDVAVEDENESEEDIKMDQSDTDAAVGDEHLSEKDIKMDKSDMDVPVEDRGSTSEPSAGDEMEKVSPNISEGAAMGDRKSNRLSLRDEEQHMVGGEILFPRSVSPLAFGGWDNLRWMSYSGARKIQHCQDIERLVMSEKKGLNLFGLGATASESYVRRKLVIYQEPTLILLLRPPNDPDELRNLLDLPEEAELDKNVHSMSSSLVVEAAAEPISCKLRLSPLTTPTSVTEKGDDNPNAKRRSCFHLITPTETIAMTAIAPSKAGPSYTDSAAFLETTTVELAISNSIFGGHSQGEQSPANSGDMSWKHQLILGTLHSDIVQGSQKLLEKAIATAMKRSKDNTVSFEGKNYLQTRLVDKVDDAGLTPLYYACCRRFSIAVADLVNAGARIDIRAGPDKLEMAPLHLSAEALDFKSLSILLSANFPVKPNPNMMDALGRTPMYIAAIDGRGPREEKDAVALGRCIMALEAWGGQMLPDPTTSQLRWPQSVLAAAWQHQELAEVLRHSSFRYPLTLPDTLLNQQKGTSLAALYQYPIHWALISLVRETQAFYNQEEGSVLCGAYEYATENKVAQ